VALVNGKRCLGGMLELLLHCHYVLSVADANLGFPEVTLPVVPGMEACHWPFRRARPADWPRLCALLLGGQPVRGEHAAGWLIDQAGALNEMLSLAWSLAHGEARMTKRPLVDGPLSGVAEATTLPEASDDAGPEVARRAIRDAILAATAVPLGEALEVQARHSAGFFGTAACRRGVVGSAWSKTVEV
jgi:enoyl-CoA hydratase/carnithine racemase